MVLFCTAQHFPALCLGLRSLIVFCSSNVKDEISALSTQNRNVLLVTKVEVSGLWISAVIRVSGKAQAVQESLGKGGRAPLASARIGALECRSGLSRL